MKIEFLTEPELEFGGGGQHIDIRFGMMQYKPLDYTSASAPKDIKLGIVGTSETVEGVQTWLESCRNGISAKPSKQPYLFPEFPGFGSESNLPTSLITDSRLNQTIHQREFDKLRNGNNVNEIIRNAVEIFISQLQYLGEKTAIDVLICAVPDKLLDLMAGDDATEASSTADNRANKAEDSKVDFHDLLKAKAMGLKKPTQLILPATYNPTKRRRQRGRVSEVELQDEATCAWNIYTALYYKALGTPWRLLRDPRELTTCYIGISFYKTLDKSKLLTSTAQIFNERGDGVILRGGIAKLSKEDKQPYLPASGASKLLRDALSAYRREHQNLPARVVLHKTSRYITEEFEGFKEALEQHNISSVDFISFDSKSYTRLFRYGKYPPLRGTLLNLDDRSQVLYTRGSVDFFSTYPGQYVPRPLRFRCEDVEQTPNFLAKEILALTKMNWNNTQFDRREPITIRAARQVGSILKYLGTSDQIEPHYRFYM